MEIRPIFGGENLSEKFSAERDICKIDPSKSLQAGLPDSSWGKIPKRGKIYQMTTKYI
jgi:hypothetical protein